MKTKFLVDMEACGDPRECMQCMRICPPALIIMYPPDYESNDPTEWKVDVAFTDLCTRCNACVDVCPKEAIRVI